jgi:uncharacterized protein
VHLVYTENEFYEDGERIGFLKPVTIDGNLSIIEDIITLEASISTELELPCSRCLNNFSYPLEIQIHEKFSNHPHEEDDDIIFIEENTIDISNIVKNNIIISLPIQKLCKEDCKGLCQHCGINFNHSSCNCMNENIDPRLSKLKDLFSAD